MQEELKKVVEQYVNALRIKKYDKLLYKRKEGNFFPNYWFIIEKAQEIYKLDDFFAFCHTLLNNYHTYYYHPSVIKEIIVPKYVYNLEESHRSDINRLLRTLELQYSFENIPIDKITKVINFHANESLHSNFESLFEQMVKLINKVEKYIRSNRFYEADYQVYDYSLEIKKDKETDEELFDRTLKRIIKINCKEYTYDLLGFDDDDGQGAVKVMLTCFWKTFRVSQYIFKLRENVSYYRDDLIDIDYDEYLKERTLKLYVGLDEFLNKIDYTKYNDNQCKNIIVLIKSMFPKALEEEVQTSSIGEQSLNSLIGLQEIKENIKRIKSYCLQNKGKRLNLHMCFYGNPGTGKTEVARIIGQIFKDNDILEIGHVVEVSRKDLVALYVGHTAIKTNNIIDSAMGGILFIDEAYSLYQGPEDDFGKEAIETLIKAMEDRRGEFCVILAGYRSDMKRLIASNEGFRSRIQFELDFPNYSRDELAQIANIFLKKDDYSITPEAFGLFMDIVEYKKKDPNFSNAREVRNSIDHCIMIQNVRIGAGKNNGIITIEDVKKYEKESKISLPASDSKYMITAEDELNQLIGLQAVKKMIKKIKASVSRNSEEVMNLHMCFYGNPGTGKTVVANIMSRLLYEIGALPEARVYSVSAKELIGEYVGQTGPKTKKAIDKAMGGVLFIDEAYSLAMSTYGDEAISLLLQEMENKRGQFVVIFAGYEKETNELLSKNPGFKSRIKFYLNFEDFNSEEIGEIIKKMIGNKYSITDDAFDRMIDVIEYYRTTSEFANARTARNLVEDVEMNQNLRTEKDDTNNIITIDDVEEYIEDRRINVPKRNEVKDDQEFINQSLVELKMIQFFSVDKSIINKEYLEQCVVSIFSNEEQGTGFIISPTGIAVTCAHCLSKSLNNQKVRVKVATSDGEMIDMIEDYVVIIIDKENDIAIIKIKGKLSKHKFIPLCSKGEVNLEPLREFYMVGYPFGGETFKNLSYVEGKIASINFYNDRKVVFADMFGKPGNSGGPIIDSINKNVIGIFFGSIGKGSELINCFTPVDLIWNLVEE